MYIQTVRYIKKINSILVQSDNESGILLGFFLASHAAAQTVSIQLGYSLQWYNVWFVRNTLLKTAMKILIMCELHAVIHFINSKNLS